MDKKSGKHGIDIEMNQVECGKRGGPVNEVTLLGEVKDEGYSSTVAGSPLFTHKHDSLAAMKANFVDNLSEKEEERETWSRKTDFLLSIIGFAVDLANVWRFPYLCYKNGGGAFLIPYALMLVFGAIPLFYMELILGQSNRSGPITVWKISPIFKGIGYCATIVSFYVTFYYNIIIGWAFYFLFASFTSELPWMTCNNEWNTDRCWNGSSFDANGTTVSVFRGVNMSSPADEYFHRAVLQLHKSQGFHNLGQMRWPLVLCLLLVFFILFLSLCKGVKSSGKVVWVTATMPYVVLTILLIRGALLPGALDGITYYMWPDLTRLLSAEVWIDAAVQIFFSVGAGFGVHLTYASYNKFHNNCYRDCLCTAAINSLTSFFSGFVIFAYLGYMATKQGVNINKVATEGPGLVFVVYPEAIATLPGSSFWAILFFFMLLMLGLDSAMGGMECVLTGILDEFKNFFSKYKRSRVALTAVVCSVSFLIALVNTTQGGAYMVQWFDVFAAGISLLGAALFEAIAVSWFYGLERFSEDVHEMMGFKPGIFWRICWKFISPIFLSSIIISAVVTFQPLTYGSYVYPGWANILGWLFACSSLAVIPGYIIIKLTFGHGTLKKRLALGITPTKEHHLIIRTGEVKRFKLRHWLQV